MIAGLGLATATPARAAATDGYSHDSSIGLTNSDWMSALPGNTPLSELSIPATHDSGASRFGGDIVETQSMRLADQLKSGIRGWDIRLGYEFFKRKLMIFHGSFPIGVNQELEFNADVLDVADRFLSDHPRETVVMRIKHEYHKFISDANFARRVKAALDGYARVYRGSSDNPLLNDVRGKIVVLQDFPANFDIGIPWTQLDLQDDYGTKSNWDLADKWHKVYQQLDASRSGPRNRIYGNFLSAAQGGFPYFFASGHSNHGTGADQLLTGWTRGWHDTCHLSSRCIPEYPSVACTGGKHSVCSVAFRGVNVMTMDVLRARGRGSRTGIVFADFPGKGLVQAVIDSNSMAATIAGTTGVAAGLPADLELPPGYTRCAEEGGGCTFDGTRAVAYGAGEAGSGQPWRAAGYRYRTSTGSVACSTSTFGGDPAPQVVKSCYVAPLGGPAGSTWCAAERAGACTSPVPTVVSYGANGVFTSRLIGAGGSIACKNEAFGADPLPNVLKGCYVAPDSGPGEGWTACAGEWNTCQVPKDKAPVIVTFGVNGAFETRLVDGDIGCTYAAGDFGSDPVPTLGKSCFVRSRP